MSFLFLELPALSSALPIEPLLAPWEPPWEKKRSEE
jgi:hypothetical protein